MSSLVLIAAAATASVQTVIAAVGPADRQGAIPVEVTLLNGGEAAIDAHPPLRVGAEVAIGGTRTAVTLERVAGVDSVLVPPRGFSRAHYRFVLPAEGVAGMTAILSVRDWSANGISFVVPGRPQVAAAASAPPSAPVLKQTLESADADTGNAFLGGLSAYEPIYGAFGSGTDSAGRLQFSLKYRLFGRGGAFGGKPSLLDGIYLAYSQRMFWDLAADSSPLRNVDYMPEAFYLIPPRRTVAGVSVGAQAGLRHESNGRDGADSRSINLAYIQPLVTMPLGDYRLTVGPRVAAYFGNREDNPDIARYRGHFALLAEIGRDDGIRLSTTSRYNFASGKGAINAELSYPLSGLLGGDINLYLMAQGFVGYGENLLDYKRKTTRARIGLGIVR